MLQVPHNPIVYTLTIQVQPEDIDEQDHVNNVVYLRWVQEVAYAHWKSIAPKEMVDRWNWVVLRHEIDYHQPAMPGETIIASTWIDLPEGPRQKRYVSIRRKTDDKQLASACTTWCLLDANTGRPKRVPAEITSLFGLKN